MTTESINNSLIKVLVIGGGLAGLTLANALKNHGIPFSVYERDVAPEARKQGYSLAIHKCLDYLKKCIPSERFENFGRETCVNSETNEGGTIFRIFDGKNGQVVNTIKGDPYKAYRVGRERFRKWLLEDVQEDVYWNKKMSHYEESQDKVTVYFTDGTQDTGDLLVAADGALSPTACQFYGGQEKFNQITHISKLRGYAMVQWISEEHWSKLSISNNQTASIIGHIDSEDKFAAGKCVRMFYTLNAIDRDRPETPYEVLSFVTIFDMDGVVPSPDESNNDKILEMVKSWGASAFSGSYPHQSLITNIPHGTPVMGLTIRERVPEANLITSPISRVVLVGDAAHPMTMFRGEGANHAIADAVNLALEIYNIFDDSKTFNESIRSYYDEMIPRGANAVNNSHVAAEKFHTGIEEITKFYKDFKV